TEIHAEHSVHHFFFQAEDGIRDFHVTGVQTCALPICEPAGGDAAPEPDAEGADETVPPYTLPDSSYEAVEVIAEPAAIDVLVNKKYALPRDYVPDDLVEPDVPFIFEEKLEKRKLRKEAAEALEALFAAAKEDGKLLAGVSGYRSYATQKSLYNWYVKRDGQEAADRYSARPGHSEHSTGLRSEEHTSELQSRENLVCRLLLEKKK